MPFATVRVPSFGARRAAENAAENIVPRRAAEHGGSTTPGAGAGKTGFAHPGATRAAIRSGAAITPRAGAVLAAPTPGRARAATRGAPQAVRRAPTAGPGSARGDETRPRGDETRRRAHPSAR